jgi:hypothetical protein
MILRTAAIAAWLAIGGTLVFGFWWLFLNTSEADVFRLILSGLYLLLAAFTAGIVVNTAMMLAAGGGFVLSARVAIRRLHWFLIGGAAVAAGAWATGAADALVLRRYGEINAWFISEMGWTETGPLFDLLRYLSVWLRWVIVPLAACAAISAAVRGLGARVALRAVTRAWRWKPMLIATVAFVVLIAWPWRAAFWVSQPIGPAWTEPMVAALRLSLIAAAASLGAAIFVTAPSRAVDRDGA